VPRSCRPLRGRGAQQARVGGRSSRQPPNQEQHTIMHHLTHPLLAVSSLLHSQPCKLEGQAESLAKFFSSAARDYKIQDEREREVERSSWPWSACDGSSSFVLLVRRYARRRTGAC
jgi:hypothetical protein